MKLIVIGGVAAGMSTAARARRLHETAEIIVFEKSHHVSFANCGLPYHVGGVIRERERLLLQTPETLRQSLNLDVRTSTEVLEIHPKQKFVTVRNLETGAEYQETYDKLAYCPGAEAFRPAIPGIDAARVFVLRRIGDMDQIKAVVDSMLATETKIAPHAVVVGAGYIGLEMAENLKHRGMSVAIVEFADQILPPLDKEMALPVENHLRSRGIDLHLGTAAAAIREDSERLTVELNNGTKVTTDLVIMAAGVRPAVALANQAGIELAKHGGIKVNKHMQTSEPDVYAAGDAVETPHTVLPGEWLAPLAGPANRQGRVAAENIMGRTTSYNSTQATSIVKVFDMAAGGTGATERQLRQEGLAFEAIHIHPTGHAGYYPGTSTMHIKLLFNPDNGLILGAQVCGYDGVDKRLDVFATALRAGQTVYDLEELELSYAPPFGSAKDPVNMAGFVASNVLRGDIQLWRAEDYPAAVEGARLVDVRTPDEYSIWHIAGAENVPLSEIRESSEDWDQSIPIRLYCGVGFRSYLAYRSLVQRGFKDVKTLNGGSTTFKYVQQLTGLTEALPAPTLNYAEVQSLFKVSSAVTGVSTNLDCTGLACPGPIMKLSESVKLLNPGDEVTITVSDPGFASDGPAWAKSNGHELVKIEPHGSGYVATFRKGRLGILSSVSSDPHAVSNKVSFVVFSGDLDKLIAAFIIANGAIAMGQQVSMFFTFWGLNSLRATKPPKRQKKVMEKMFAIMMPADANHTKLSQMHMAGAGTAMIKSVMKKHNVKTLPELMSDAQAGGARLIACTMTMDLLGIAPSDLMGDVEFGGVAAFLGEASDSKTTMFI